MAEPILISQGDMNNIQRLPVTPPEDVIHEIGTPIMYHPAPPRDANGKPVACPPSAFQAASNRIMQPPVPDFKPVVKSDTILAILLSIIGTLAIVIGVWFGIKLASGPGGDAMKKIGDSIGKTLAGSYAAVKKASPSISIPTALPALPKDTSVFSTQNPGFSSKADFIASRRRTPTTTTPKPGLTVRTPPPAAPKPKINSGLTVRTPPAAPKPAPKPAEPVVMAPNPSGETKDQFRARMMQKRALKGGKRRRRNRLKTGRKV
jgi:hypothetical protein